MAAGIVSIIFLHLSVLLQGLGVGMGGEGEGHKRAQKYSIIMYVGQGDVVQHGEYSQ